MANEFKVKNGLIVIGELTTSGTITINGALAATQSWVTSQAYLTSSSLTSYATQSYVTSAIASLVDSAPGALDTLRELATALGNDASFSTTVTNSIAAKQAQLNGTGFVKVSGTSVSYDNSTYLTSYTETDTLSSVTGRGATTNTSITVGPDLTVQADGSYNYTASRLWLNSHNNYRGAGVHMSGTGSTWFAGTPYTDFDGGYVIARTGTTNDQTSAQYSNALLTVKSSGNVGIGTSNPGSKLSVFGNNDVFSVISQTGDTSIPTKLLAQYVGLFNNGANGHHLYVSSSQELGPAEFNLTKTWGGVLTLGVSSDGTFRTRALYVNSNGYVGVNVNPISGDRFEVAGSVRIHTGNNWDAIQIYSDGANGYIQGLGDETGLRIRSEAGNILLADNRGSVGIGTSSPSTKLDVNGVITATGGNSTNWNTAYGWGNHASVGYITSAGSISGNAATATYATSAGALSSMNISQFTNNSGYITGYTETDTLASVTGRGASTSTAVTFSGGATITGLTIAKSAGVSTITFPAGSNDPAFISHTESTANNAIMRFSVGDDNDTNDHFVFGNTGNPDAFRINANGTISTGTWQGTAIADAYISSAATWNAKQSALNGTGFVKITGTTISYDNSTYYLASNPSGYITSSGSISGNAGTATSASNIILTSLGTATTNVSNSYSAVYRNENGLGGNMTYAPVLHLGGGDTMWQIQGDYYSSTDLRWRAGYNGTWYAWRQIYHSGNFTDNSANWNTAYGWGNHASYSYATTSYVTTQINNLINGAPGALDTLDELAAALGDDASFATTVTNSIATKLPLAGGTMSGNLQVNAKVGTLDNQGIYLRGIADATHKIYYRTSDGGNVWEYNSPIKFEYYNNGIPLTRLTLDIAGNLTIGGFLTESSSLKLKENVETSEGNLEKVVNLRPVTYNKIGSQTKELGLIAEEVATVYPEFVQYDESGEPVGVNYSRLTAALIGAVKELTQRIETLENNG